MVREPARGCVPSRSVSWRVCLSKERFKEGERTRAYVVTRLLNRGMESLSLLKLSHFCTWQQGVHIATLARTGAGRPTVHCVKVLAFLDQKTGCKGLPSVSSDRKMEFLSFFVSQNSLGCFMHVQAIGCKFFPGNIFKTSEAADFVDFRRWFFCNMKSSGNSLFSGNSNSAFALN